MVSHISRKTSEMWGTRLREGSEPSSHYIFGSARSQIIPRNRNAIIRFARPDFLIDVHDHRLGYTSIGYSVCARVGNDAFSSQVGHHALACCSRDKSPPPRELRLSQASPGKRPCRSRLRRDLPRPLLLIQAKLILSRNWSTLPSRTTRTPGWHGKTPRRAPPTWESAKRLSIQPWPRWWLRRACATTSSLRRTTTGRR